MHVNISQLTKAFDGPNPDRRQELRTFFDRPRYKAKDIQEERQVVRQELQRILQSGYAGLKDLQRRPSHILDLCEFAFWSDPSLGAAFFATYLIFGGCLISLSTEQHQKFLDRMNRGHCIGIFAMTEVEHGSDVQSLGTTAHYDPNAREFILHTPNFNSLKWGIALAAGASADIAAVFARLILPNNLDMGIHAFLVPVRDDDGNMCSGVTTSDCGRLLGLDGVGIGGLQFDRVHVPRANLLNRFGDVTEEGEYLRKLPAGVTHFEMMMSIFCRERAVGFPAAGCGIVLSIATAYAHKRRQFAGDRPGEERTLIDYQTQRLPLLSGIAENSAMICMGNFLKKTLDAQATSEKPAEKILHALTAGVKAFHAERGLRIITEIRGLCGFHSWRYDNGLGPFYHAAGAFTHAAGDNVVLKQQTGKFLLKQPKIPWLFDEEDAFPDAFALLSRQATLLKERADRFHGIVKSAFIAALAGPESVEMKEKLSTAWNKNLAKIISMVDAYIEAETYRSFLQAIVSEPFAENQEVLIKLCELYGWSIINRDAASFPKLFADDPFAVKNYMIDLCDVLAPHGLDLVQAFGIPKKLLPQSDLLMGMESLFLIPKESVK